MLCNAAPDEYYVQDRSKTQNVQHLLALEVSRPSERPFLPQDVLPGTKTYRGYFFTSRDRTGNLCSEAYLVQNMMPRGRADRLSGRASPTSVVLSGHKLEALAPLEQLNSA